MTPERDAPEARRASSGLVGPSDYAVTDIGAIADALLAAYDGGHQLAPITEGMPAFDVPSAYAVLHEIEGRRVARVATVGRKIGFSNRTIGPLRCLPTHVGTWRETVVTRTMARRPFACAWSTRASSRGCVRPRGLCPSGRRARRPARGNGSRRDSKLSIALPRMEVQGAGLPGVRVARGPGRRHARAVTEADRVALAGVAGLRIDVASWLAARRSRRRRQRARQPRAGAGVSGACSPNSRRRRRWPPARS